MLLIINNQTCGLNMFSFINQSQNIVLSQPMQELSIFSTAKIINVVNLVHILHNYKLIYLILKIVIFLLKIILKIRSF